MKTIIAGSRTFTDYKLLCDSCEVIIKSELTRITEVVSGGARGADRLGERYADERNIPVKVFKAYWDILGKKAGILRNLQMAEYADQLIAFWDGKSKGTKHMIDSARKAGLKVYIIRV